MGAGAVNVPVGLVLGVDSSEGLAPSDGPVEQTPGWAHGEGHGGHGSGGAS